MELGANGLSVRKHAEEDHSLELEIALSSAMAKTEYLRKAKFKTATHNPANRVS